MKKAAEKKWILIATAALLIGGIVLVIALKMWGMDKVIFLEDYRHYHKAAWKKGPLADDSADFSFRLDYIYRGKEPDIAFVSFDNEAANECLISMSEVPGGDEAVTEGTGTKSGELEAAETEDGGAVAEQVAYKGYRMGCKEFCFDFSSLDTGSVFEINEITLSVDGKKKTISTKGNIICEYLSDTDERYWSEALGVLPDTYFNPDYLDSYGAGKLYFVVANQRETVLDRLEFRDFITMPEVDVFLGAIYQGTADQVFPIELNKGDTLIFRVRNMDFGEYGKSYEDMAFFDTELLAYYRDGEGAERILTVNGEALEPESASTFQRELIHQVLAGKRKVKTQTAVPADRMEVSATDGMERKYVSVSLDVLCKNCDPHIVWKGFDNPEAEKLLDSVSTEVVYGKPDGKGYRIKRVTLTFQLGEMNQAKNIEIGSIKLSVAGEEVTVDTAGRFSLAYEPSKCMFADTAKGNICVSSSEEVLTYVYKAREDGVLEDVTLEDERMRIVSAGVILDKKDYGDLKETLPLSVKAGQELSITMSVDRGSLDSYTRYLTNVNLRFSDKDGTYISKDLLELAPYPSSDTVVDAKVYEEYLKHVYKKR